MTIAITDYFGKKEAGPGMWDAATGLLEKVNELIDGAIADGAFERKIDPDTGTEISGAKGGSGDGGFRAATSTTGRLGSKHRAAHAVDVYDPENKLDDWLNDDVLTAFGLYREAPEDTPGWCHLQDVPPASGERTFTP